MAVSQKKRTFAHALRNHVVRQDPLAQLVEHNTFNVGVLGSSPKRITHKVKTDIVKPLITKRYQRFYFVPGARSDVKLGNLSGDVLMRNISWLLAGMSYLGMTLTVNCVWFMDVAALPQFDLQILFHVYVLLSAGWPHAGRIVKGHLLHN